jgi:hypothetical protein
MGMNRNAIGAALVGLAVAACSGTTDTTATTAATTAPTTTTAATTTTAPATTTLPPTTTAAVVEPQAFPREPGTPTELDSFSGTSDVTFSADDLELGMHSDGVYVGNAFRCDTAMDLGGFSFTLIAVGTPEATWLDDGTGFVEVSGLDPDFDSAAGTCPANPAFWNDGGFVPPSAQGEPDTVNGIASQRLELSEFLSSLAGFGFEMQGMTFEDATIWIADDGGWIVKVDMTFTIAADSAETFFGPGFDIIEDAEMRMVVEIADPNDPSLTVDVPA